MIVQSPESPMPEPYKSYVDERAGNIAATLGTIVGEETDVQLCPRVILPAERYFREGPEALVYGCIAPSHENGYKSALYRETDPGTAHGIVARTVQRAESYASLLIQRGDRVRIKDPEGTNCMGQSVAATMPEVNSFFRVEVPPKEMILMPHLNKIIDRFSIGRIQLGAGVRDV